MIILVNGPPSSGKDTVVEFITLMIGNSKVHHEKLSRPMKSALAKVFNFNSTELGVLELYKDAENGVRYGDMNWREMQISMFKYLADAYGEGILFVRRNRDNAKMHTVVSDAGRNVEITPILRDYPFKDIGYIELHREGCNYDNDIREYLNHDKFMHVEVIDNKYDLELFKVQVRKVLRKWELVDDGDN